MEKVIYIAKLLFSGIKRPGDDSISEGSKKSKPDVSLNCVFNQLLAVIFLALIMTIF